MCSCSWSSEAFTGFSNSFDPGLQKGAEGCKQRFTVQWKVWQIVNLHLGLHTYSLCFVYSHTLACVNPVKRTWIQCRCNIYHICLSVYQIHILSTRNLEVKYTLYTEYNAHCAVVPSTLSSSKTRLIVNSSQPYSSTVWSHLVQTLYSTKYITKWI